MTPFTNHFFGDLADQDWAKDAYAFLNQPEVVRRMEVVSLLGHTALDAVVLDLEEAHGSHFGPDGDRARQMIGAMIKAVLEPRGWVIAQQGMKVVLGHQFTVATRYEKRPTPVSGDDSSATFLGGVASRYGVRDTGRHYILIPCAGITIGVDDLQRDGTRRVHAFTDRKAHAPQLWALATAVKDAVSRISDPSMTFIDRHGARNHERRYVGWEWKATRAQRREIEAACKLVETLRTAWLGMT